MLSSSLHNPDPDPDDSALGARSAMEAPGLDTNLPLNADIVDRAHAAES